MTDTPKTSVAELVTEAMVDAALNARVPGGAEVKDWLPSIDGRQPHPTARAVIRTALEATMKAPAPDAGMREALQFYADNWKSNAEGDFSEPGLSRSWMEPTDALWDDTGQRARDAIALASAPQPAASEATMKAEPVAYLHEVIEPADKTHHAQSSFLYSSSPENPWSHWTEAHLERCEYRRTPLYAGPPSDEAQRLRALLARARLAVVDWSTGVNDQLLADMDAELASAPAEEKG